MRKLVLFVLAFGLWILLAWPPTGQAVVVGLCAALVVALVMRDAATERFGQWLNPVRWFWAAVYLVIFAYYLARANIDVAYRVLHPAMPIHPGIVKARTRLKTASARTALANSITLTPGTMTVDVIDDGTLYVHWINVKTQDVEQATEAIAGRFEWFLKKIFE